MDLEEDFLHRDTTGHALFILDIKNGDNGKTIK